MGTKHTKLSVSVVLVPSLVFLVRNNDLAAVMGV